MSGRVSGTLSVDVLFAETKRLATAAWLEVSFYLIVMTALGVATDLIEGMEGGYFLFNIVSVALIYVMVVGMIRKGGLLNGTQPNRFGAYFVISLLSGLGIIVGALLLLVPGFVLWVRWLPAYGFGLVEGLSATESLGRSWDATRSHFWPLLLASLVPLGLFIAGAGFYYFAFPVGEAPSIPAVVAANLAMVGATAIATVLGLASYALLCDNEDLLPEVFA